MTIEEQLKNEILNNYKSIRAFTQKIDIPYSTLDTIFKRGIGGAGVNTVLKIFNELSLDIESIDKGVLTPNNSNNTGSVSPSVIRSCIVFKIVFLSTEPIAFPPVPF